MSQDSVPITVTIDYSKEPKDRISVDPEVARIYYNSGPKKVSWEVVNLAPGDEVIVSSKRYLADQVRTLFGQSEIKLTDNPTAGDEHEPSQAALAALQALAATPHQKIYWIYDVILRSNGDTIGYCDPIVLIDSDP